MAWSNGRKVGQFSQNIVLEKKTTEPHKMPPTGLVQPRCPAYGGKFLKVWRSKFEEIRTNARSDKDVAFSESS